MARWGATFNKGSASVQTVALLVAAASNMRRAKVYDLTIGCDASPADNAFVHIGQRCSTAGTGAALTPNALDPADSLASTIVAKDTITSDPTLTANAFVFPGFALNQRASFRWVAAPYGEIIIPATASNGVIFGLKAATTTSFQYGVQYEEL
jgi:hypothetical protein